MKTLQFHPLSNTFPMMSELEYQGHKADIQKNGLLQPILIYEGMILDGRNRYNACKELGIDIKTEEFKGTEMEAANKVVSLNIHRRHLNTSQIAIVATDIYERVCKEQIKIRNKKLSMIRRGVTFAKEEAPIVNKSADEVGKMFNIGPDTIALAVRVKRHCPDLVPKIMAGSITVWRCKRFLPRFPRKKIHADPLNDDLATAVCRQIDNQEPFVLPTQFDTYEKFMQFIRQVNDRGFMIQAVWCNRKVFLQIMEENKQFIGWNQRTPEPDFKRAFVIEAQNKLKKLAQNFEPVAA
jgi:hypothetical protein